MMDVDKWKDLLSKKKSQNSVQPKPKKKKEKRVIGYENPRVALKYAVVEREVDNHTLPDKMYIKTLGDYRIVIDLIYDNRDAFVDSCKAHFSEGWKLDECHEQMDSVLRKEVPGWFE